MAGQITNKGMDVFNEYKKKLKGTWGDRYEFMEQPYVNYNTPLKLMCNRHGEFTCSAANALAFGCPRCIDIGLGRGNSNRVDPNIILNRLQDKYPQFTFPYFEAEYVFSQSKITVVCSKHGSWQTNTALLQHRDGPACKQCAIEINGKSKRSSTEEFITKAKVKHGERFDYSKTKYVTSFQDVEVICREHGSFFTLPNNHLRGATCSKCKYEIQAKAAIVPFEVFVGRARLVHTEYEYSDEDYKGTDSEVNIKCSVHGWFKQIGYVHLGGARCKKCAGRGSKGQEELLSYIKNLGFEAVADYRYGSSRQEVDVYVPELKIAFEYNGVYWHSSKYRANDFHFNKFKECEALGIRLIHIFSDEWKNKSEIVKQLIRMRLGKTIERLPARKCSITQIDDNTARSFYNKYHIQGWDGSGENYALMNGEITVAVMTFSQRIGETQWELARFASSKQVVGGASKLLAHARKQLNFTGIVSYSYNRLFEGGMYKALGFKLKTKIRPTYTYMQPSEDIRLHKSLFRHSKLARKFGSKYDPTLTEKQNCENNGYYQIYDCGLTKWELTL